MVLTLNLSKWPKPATICWVIYLLSGIPLNQGHAPFETCAFSSLLKARLNSSDILFKSNNNATLFFLSCSLPAFKTQGVSSSSTDLSSWFFSRFERNDFESLVFFQLSKTRFILGDEFTICVAILFE